MQEFEARLNITFAGQNGDLADPVAYDATDADIKRWASEAIANGSVVGINATAGADFTDFVVDRFPATEAITYNRLMLRPKTPFGGF